MTEHFRLVGLPAGESEPKNIHWRAVIVALQPGAGAKRRVPPVGSDHQVGADCQFAVGAAGANADNATVFLDEIGRLSLHSHMESFVAFAAFGEEIQKIPLRHQRDIFAVRRQMSEIEHLQARVTDLNGEPLEFLMRYFEERVEQTELIHQLERRGMYGIAAKIAEKIGMLLQNDDVNAGAGEKKAQHHSSRAAAGNAACGRNRRVGHYRL